MNPPIPPYTCPDRTRYTLATQNGGHLRQAQLHVNYIFIYNSKKKQNQQSKKQSSVHLPFYISPRFHTNAMRDLGLTNLKFPLPGDQLSRFALTTFERAALQICALPNTSLTSEVALKHQHFVHVFLICVPIPYICTLTT